MEHGLKLFHLGSEAENDAQSPIHCESCDCKFPQPIPDHSRELCACEEAPRIR